MRIVFMGTPDYSVPSLSKLIDAGHEILAVFSQPDKPVGRKQVLTPPPTKVFASSHNIPVYQPDTLRDGEALNILKDINPDLIVVVAYGKILPKEILSLPKFGCINGHASLLPKLRGASPIQWAIVTGEDETGITVMQMDEGMDTGDILATVKARIFPEDTSGSLFDRLSVLTGDLLVKTIVDLENNEIIPKKQDNSMATYAPIIKKDMAHLDFSNKADTLVNIIRGFNPWPVAYCFVGNRRLKIFSAKAVTFKSGSFGEVISNNDRLIVSCGDNTAIEFLTVQPEGGKVMKSDEMMRGKPIPIGTILV